MYGSHGCASIAYCSNFSELESHSSPSHLYEQISISWFGCNSVWEVSLAIYCDADKMSKTTKNAHLCLSRLTELWQLYTFSWLARIFPLAAQENKAPPLRNDVQVNGSMLSPAICSANEPGRDKSKGKFTPLVTSHNIQAGRRRGCKDPHLHYQTSALDGGQWLSPRYGHSYFEAPMDRRMDRQKCSFALWWT
jgi:hypothetical protein